MSAHLHDCIGDILIDGLGKIISFSGSLSSLGLDTAHVGLPWQNAFPGLQSHDAPGPDGEVEPPAVYRLDRDGETYQMAVHRHIQLGDAAPVASITVHSISATASLSQLARRLDKQATLTDLVAGIAHEINNPLTCITGWLQLLLDDAKEPDGEARGDAATLVMLLEEANRVSKIVTNLLNYARPSRPKQVSLQLDLLLDEILELVEYQMRNRNIVIERRFHGPIAPIMGDPAGLKQVFLNLIINARNAMPKGGSLLAEVGMGNGQVEVRIEDSGVGIPADHLCKVFERGFTTRGDQGGTGLGLPVTKEIVEAHGGSIDVQSQPGHGALFTIRVPVKQRQAHDAMPVRRWLQSGATQDAHALVQHDSN